MAVIEKMIKDMTKEELRAYKRDSAAKARAHKPEKQAQKKFEAAIAACRTLQEFWAVNRAKDADVVAALQPQVELAADQRYWMESGWKYAPTDPDFVGLREGFADLNSAIAASGGLIKEVRFANPDLQEYSPGYSIWRDFWRETWIYEALRAENSETSIYAQYGLETSIFESMYITFTQNVRRHRETRLGPNVFTSGWKGHVEYEGDRCYLCRYKTHHGTEYEE